MDENQVIDLIARSAGRLPRGYLPIGDDVAALPSGPGGVLVLKADMLVAKTDVPPGMTWRQVGRKSVAMCVSDFAAKGVSPEVFMVSLALPRSLSDGDIRSLVGGFVDGSREWGVRLVGGDTNEGDDVVVDCTMAGFADRITKRDGARPGELVVVTGDFGTTSAGLKILLEGASSRGSFRKSALANVYLPSPRLKLGLALSRFFSATMDSSDGLAICLHTIARMSRVGMKLSRLPYDGRLESFAARNGYRVDELVLYGGEEYEIVGTIRRELFEEAQRLAVSMGEELQVIGETTAKREILSPDRSRVKNKGWVHLV